MRNDDRLEKWILRIATPVVCICALAAIIITIDALNGTANTLISNRRIEPQIKYYVENNKVDSVFIYERIEDEKE